jgi:hypothetical protein
MTSIAHSTLRCPVCDSSLDRDTVRPPCPNGCKNAYGLPRLAVVASPRTGRPICSDCAAREGRPWTDEERAEWKAAAFRDARRENGGGW